MFECLFALSHLSDLFIKEMFENYPLDPSVVALNASELSVL